MRRSSLAIRGYRGECGTLLCFQYDDSEHNSLAVEPSTTPRGLADAARRIPESTALRRSTRTCPASAVTTIPTIELARWAHWKPPFDP
jgi:hypothetical protein